jgi:hypothetical protein
VRAHSDGRAEVLATAPYVMVAGGGGVWRLVEGRVSSKLLDCECFFENPDADADKGECTTTGEVNHYKLTDALSGKVLATYGTTTTDNRSFGELETWAGIVGSAGAAVFVATTTDGFACGAHGSITSGLDLIDLSTGASLLDRAAMESAQKAAPDLRAKAAEAFKLHAEVTLIDDVPADQAGGALTMVYPIYPDASAAPQWRYQFTRDACYACSDGRWDSYSVSEWVDSPNVPKGMPAASPAPAAVQKAWAEVNANNDTRGFSALTLDDAAAAKLLAAMKAP